MALRLGGTYLLAGTALRSQSRVAYHLSRMEMTASEAIVLNMASDAELESSMILRGESAIDSEEGLTLQGEAAEHELDAEREFLASEVEYAAGDGFEAEAGETRASAERDALESEASFVESEAADIESSALRGRAEVEGGESASDSERSVAYWEGSTNAGRVATAAEEGAAEYGAVAAGDAASGLGDGEALARAEAGAMEDAEVMAACAPIPVLNLLCEAVGSIAEVGYQSIAAFEGAKAAVDGVSAALARGRERTELVLAVEKREEAARLALEAERLQIEAEEEGAMAAADEYRSEAMAVEAREEEALGEERLEESEREEALVVVLEEVRLHRTLGFKHDSGDFAPREYNLSFPLFFLSQKASEEYAKAARDEGIAMEEESSAIASQLESDELMSKSASEEFESLAERADAIARDAEAEGLLKQSLGYGIRALGFVIHAIATAGLVVYAVAMKGFMKTVVPGVGRMWNGEHRVSAVCVLERMCDFAIHLSVAIGAISSMPIRFSDFEGVSAPMRIRALFLLAVVAGVIESVVKGVIVGSTIATASLRFFSNLVHLVPVYMMELLILLVLLGPGFFDEKHLVRMKPLLIWFTLVLLKCISMWVTKFRVDDTKHTLNRWHIDEGECDFFRARDGRSKGMRLPVDVNQEYGSMEDVSLLSSSAENEIIINKSVDDTSAPGNCLERCRKTLFDYCEGLRLSSDLLVLSLMVSLMWHCWPLLKVLHPVAETLMGTITAWVSQPILIAATVVLVVIFHFLFVH